jgi:hypothetical protein
VRRGSNRSGSQTVRIVIEQPQQHALGRDIIGKTIDNTAPKKAKF